MTNARLPQDGRQVRSRSDDFRQELRAAPEAPEAQGLQCLWQRAGARCARRDWQKYLSKLRQSAGVKSLIERLWSSDDWANVGGGYYPVETPVEPVRLESCASCRRRAPCGEGSARGGEPGGRKAGKAPEETRLCRRRSDEALGICRPGDQCRLRSGGHRTNSIAIVAIARMALTS